MLNVYRGQCFGDQPFICWALLPVASCRFCHQFGAKLRSHYASQGPNALLHHSLTSHARCPFHMKPIGLFAELGDTFLSSGKKASLRQSTLNGILYDDDHEESSDNSVPAPSGSALFPNCFNPQETGDDECTCLCIEPIACWSGVQTSVCPSSGKLRLCWINQGNQLSVITCSLELRNGFAYLPANSLTIYPQGSFLRNVKPRRGKENLQPFHFKEPVLQFCAGSNLLLHNFCSSCLSWPSKCEACQTRGGQLEVSPLALKCCLNSGRCFELDEMFSKTAHVGQLDHLHMADFLSQQPVLSTHPCCVTGAEVREIDLSLGMFTDRPLLETCCPVNYVAFLQDANAAYISWAFRAVAKGEEMPRENDNFPSQLHSLTGMCFDSVNFDAFGWRTKQRLQRPESGLHGRIDQAIFDFPSDSMSWELTQQNEEKTLFHLCPDDEPNLVLIFECIGEEKRHSHMELLEAIDLSSGRRLPAKAFQEEQLRAWCHSCPSKRPKHANSMLHELNNNTEHYGKSLRTFNHPTGLIRISFCDASTTY